MRWFGHRTAQAAAVAASLVLLASGCSSSDDKDPASSDLKGSPIKVALFINESGPLPSGEENAGPVVRAWADDVNANAGVAGHPVEIVVTDTKGDAPTATAAARKLAGDPSVVAAVMFDAATEGLVAEDITKAGLPVIGGMGYAPNAWGAMPNWLPLTTSIPSIFNMGMTLGSDLGADKVAMTICAEIAGCEAAEPIVKATSSSLGLDYTGTYKISSASPDYTAQCLKIVDSGTDYVMLGAATATAALRLAADCTKQDYKGQWGLFGGVIVPKTMKEADPGVPLGLAINSFPWFADDSPVKEYQSIMKDGDVSEDAWGDPHGTAAYATMELFEKALNAGASELSATPTRKDVIAAYAAHVKNETLDGLLPQPITFNADKPNALVTCYWFGSFEGGKFSKGELTKPTCDPADLGASS